MSDRKQLHHIVVYLISKLVDVGAAFGKTKLVKLLYLIDIEAYKLSSRKVTGLNWRFYHYGPYTTEIDQVLKELDLDIPQEDVTTAAGHKATVFRPPRFLIADLEKEEPTFERLIADRVVDEWGLEDLNPILSEVYFRTEPMKDAKRGDILDFAKVTRQLGRTGKQIIKTPSEMGGLKELRAKFQYTKKGHERWPYESLEPKPRFDATFWDGFRNMVINEQYSIPKGSTDINDESKANIRQQSESE